jgi:hypothetical protein
MVIIAPRWGERKEDTMNTMQRLEIEDRYGYMVEADGEIKAPCGCYACNEGVLPGHFACSTPPPVMLQAEHEGLVWRRYDIGAWRWYAY